jgi:hypothetical protein
VDIKQHVAARFHLVLAWFVLSIQARLVGPKLVPFDLPAHAPNWDDERWNQLLASAEAETHQVSLAERTLVPALGRDFIADATGPKKGPVLLKQRKRARVRSAPLGRQDRSLSEEGIGFRASVTRSSIQRRGIRVRPAILIEGISPRCNASYNFDREILSAMLASVGFKKSDLVSTASSLLG